jgi:hypothetical protein
MAEKDVEVFKTDTDVFVSADEVRRPPSVAE